jgi:hypothetical protein
MSLIENERTKLTANALDRASTACLTVGVFGPVVATLYNFGGANALITSPLLIGGSLLWIVAAILLHWMARRVLGRLK